MANVRIQDLPAASGADISPTALIEIETAGGQSRKMSIQQFLAYLGIPVGTLASHGTPAVGTDNQLAFGTDVRKVGEGVGAGTGSLIMTVDISGWQRVADAATAAS